MPGDKGTEWWHTSRWGVRYADGKVVTWPDERRARERAAREPVVQLMHRDDAGDWRPAE